MAIRIEIIGDDVTDILADMQKFADALGQTLPAPAYDNEDPQKELDFVDVDDVKEQPEPAPKKAEKKSDKKTEKIDEDHEPTLDSVTTLAQQLYDVDELRADVRAALKDLGLKNFADVPEDKISDLNAALQAVASKQKEAA